MEKHDEQILKDKRFPDYNRSQFNTVVICQKCGRLLFHGGQFGPQFIEWQFDGCITCDSSEPTGQAVLLEMKKWLLSLKEEDYCCGFELDFGMDRNEVLGYIDKVLQAYPPEPDQGREGMALAKRINNVLLGPGSAETKIQYVTSLASEIIYPPEAKEKCRICDGKKGSRNLVLVGVWHVCPNCHGTGEQPAQPESGATQKPEAKGEKNNETHC